MAHRRTSLALIVYTALWFGVFVPSHERGAVRLSDGSPTCHAAHATCCPATGTTDQPNEPSPQRDPASDCAVCHLVTTLQTPPAVATIASPGERLIERLQTCETVALTVRPLSSRRDRAPPVGLA